VRATSRARTAVYQLGAHFCTDRATAWIGGTVLIVLCGIYTLLHTAKTRTAAEITSVSSGAKSDTPDG
jgi:hypothetical protein